MMGRLWILRFVLITLVLISLRVNSLCEFSFTRRNKVFNFNLASSIRNFPHGVLSEDGFYKVEANGTVLWFQLCDVLIFNHDPPRCVGCEDCGGPSHCGTSCSGLVSENVRGYDVCTSVGYASSTQVDVFDKEDPAKGVIVKMSSGSGKENCSLSVSVICQKNKVDGPLTLDKSGTCHYGTTGTTFASLEYFLITAFFYIWALLTACLEILSFVCSISLSDATQLRHPSGCVAAISSHDGGWGWFSTLLIIILCLFGVYLIGGSVYRYHSLGIRGIEVIPNSDFWVTVPNRIQGCFASLFQRFSGSSRGQRSSYSPVNF